VQWTWYDFLLDKNYKGMHSSGFPTAKTRNPICLVGAPTQPGPRQQIDSNLEGMRKMIFLGKRAILETKSDAI
jgi:hypothetical protein